MDLAQFLARADGWIECNGFHLINTMVFFILSSVLMLCADELNAFHEDFLNTI